MDLLKMFVVGGLVGWLASILMRSDKETGILANVPIGIVGSFVGNAVAALLGVAHEGAASRWIVALLGAAFLIALLRLLGVFSRLETAR
jgi:uncharacterized membrane protein YeaQ/YmgE (transglycosylase-associated protein family)